MRGLKIDGGLFPSIEIQIAEIEGHTSDIRADVDDEQLTKMTGRVWREQLIEIDFDHAPLIRDQVIVEGQGLAAFNVVQVRVPDSIGTVIPSPHTQVSDAGCPDLEM